MRGRLFFAVVVALAVACEAQPTPPPAASSGREGSATAPARPAQPAPLAAPPVAPEPTVALDPNPLHLPSRRIALDSKKRVFAPSDTMLAGAKIGSSIVLYAATALGLDGDDVIVEGRSGPSYKVNASYVIPVPDTPRIKPGDAVVVEHAGILKHALVAKMKKDKTYYRFTDLEAKLPDVELKAARVFKQVEGLVAGNYAAWHDGDVWRHVLLVSSLNDHGAKKWFALGFAGAALEVDESALRPIPVTFSPKVGATVWAESVGTMRKAVVTAIEDPGLFTVKFERAGRPAVVGLGLVMQPAE